MTRATNPQIKSMHLGWFKKMLIENGAPKEIKDRQVRASCGFKDSEKAYVMGWRVGIEVHEDFLRDEE